MRFASQATTLATLLAGACYTATVHAAGRKLMTGFEESGIIFGSQADSDVELAELAEPDDIIGKSAPRKGSFEASIRRKAIAAARQCTPYDGGAEDAVPLFDVNNWDSQIVYDDKSGATLHVGCYVEKFGDDPATFQSAVFWEVPTDGAWYTSDASNPYVRETATLGRKRFTLLGPEFTPPETQFQTGDWIAAKADGSVAYHGAGFVFAIPTVTGLHQGNDSVLFTLTFDVTKARPSVYKSKNAPFKLLSNITYDPFA